MIFFPNCKINLGLRILNKREDGFHNLETVFYPININDALEGVNVNAASDLQFTQTGLTVDGNTDDNICVKAYQLLKKDFGFTTGIKIHLHKAIPMGAGLGGGSADGAFALQLLNKILALQLTQQQLINYALQLGSDCPFFIINEPCLATGRGEILQRLKLDLSAYKIAVINPGIHVNTGWAFTQLAKNKISPAITNKKTLTEIITQPIASWQQELQNDFEIPVFEHHPTIKQLKQHLYDAGALYASMSGSGSTVFGIFNKKVDLHLTHTQAFFTKWV
jgi:4-diphosphocytidyl-2-C-methyl-D-erythritol kinase